MDNNESKDRFHPLLMKQKVSENIISSELSRVQGIFNERFDKLNIIISEIKEKLDKYKVLKNEKTQISFISGNSVNIEIVVNLEKKLYADIQKLKLKEKSMMDLLKNAENKINDLQKELGEVNASKRMTERISEMRESLNDAIKNISEDIDIEELYIPRDLNFRKEN
jgi:hypothetical protein